VWVVDGVCLGYFFPLHSHNHFGTSGARFYVFDYCFLVTSLSLLLAGSAISDGWDKVSIEPPIIAVGTGFHGNPLDSILLGIQYAFMLNDGNDFINITFLSCLVCQIYGGTFRLLGNRPLSFESVWP